MFGCDRPPGFPDLLCQLLLCPRRVRCHLDADDLPEILDRIEVRTLCWPADPFKVLSLPTPLTISICDRGHCRLGTSTSIAVPGRAPGYLTTSYAAVLRFISIRSSCLHTSPKNPLQVLPCIPIPSQTLDVSH